MAGPEAIVLMFQILWLSVIKRELILTQICITDVLERSTLHINCFLLI